MTGRNEKLSASLNENNINKKFIIKESTDSTNQLLTATISDEVIGEDWKRTFAIHNSNDSEIASLKYMGNYIYCISLKNLLEKLKTGSAYYLYTIALPTDPKKAMLVKVARNLVCKIIIKS